MSPDITWVKTIPNYHWNRDPTEWVGVLRRKSWKYRTQIPKRAELRRTIGGVNLLIKVFVHDSEISMNGTLKIPSIHFFEELDEVVMMARRKLLDPVF